MKRWRSLGVIWLQSQPMNDLGGDCQPHAIEAPTWYSIPAAALGSLLEYHDEAPSP